MLKFAVKGKASFELIETLVACMTKRTNRTPVYVFKLHCLCFVKLFHFYFCVVNYLAVLTFHFILHSKLKPCKLLHAERLLVCLGTRKA